MSKESVVLERKPPINFNVEEEVEETAEIQFGPVGTIISNKSESIVDEQNAPIRTSDRPEQFRSTFHEVVCVAILAMASAVGNISTGAFQLALPELANQFQVFDGSLTWTIASFSLACGSFLLFMGGVADTFGRKQTLLASYIIYSISSLAGAFTKSFISFCITRSIQGIAAAAAPPAAVGILSTIYNKPTVRKNKSMAAFASAAPVGYFFGIIAGGIFCEFLSWKAILYFLTIVYGLCAVGVWKLVPYPMNAVVDDDHQAKSLKEKLRGFDYGGILLAVGGLTLFTFAITQANSLPDGWRSPTIISLLIIGFVLIVGFCFYENYIPSNPLMPMSIWKYPGVALCMFVSTCGWISFNGITAYYCPLYFLKVLKASPILATAYLAPFPIFGVSVNIFAAFTLHRIAGKYLLLAGNIGYVGSALIWALIPFGANYWALPLPSMLLGVIGADLAYNVGNLYILRSVSLDLQSSAAGVFNTMLQVSVTIGLASSSAVVSTIVQNQNTASPELLLRGYHAGEWLAVGTATLGLVLTPFLKIGKQGVEEVSSEEIAV